MMKLVKKLKIDVVLGYHFIPHGIFAYLSTSFSKVPFIYGQTGGYVQQLFMRSFFMRKTISRVLNKAKFINVPGSKSKQFWTDNSFNSEKINLLHSTIDTDIFIPSNHKKEFDFIFLGQLIPRKQILKIIKAFEAVMKINSQVKMLIVGDGSSKEELVTYVEERKIESNVIFAGFQKNTWDWFNKAKIFVMNSTIEGLPTALMQAMSCELVCISNDVDNISDLLIHNETGLIFPNINEEKLKELMIHAYTNYDDFKTMRNQGREHIVKNHSFASASTKWQFLIGEILS